MKRPRFLVWLIVWLALAAATAGFWFLLKAQGAFALSAVVYAVGSLLGAAWTVAALVWWRHLAPVAKASRLILLTLGLGLAVGLCLTLDFRGPAIMFAGIWGMAVAFGLGLELIRLLLTPGWAVLGVARTLIDEAIRMKMALIFVVMLVLLVPILPLMLGGETRLQYRLESFLTYALTVVSALLSVMTILLAVRTISSELDEKQAFLSLTKPVSRTGYLAGKWLGIMALNLLLLGVSGIGVYAFVQVIKQQPAMDLADAAAVQEQVLTARGSADPVPIDNAVLAIDFERRLEDLRRRGVDPSLYGQPGDPVTRVTEAQRQRIQLDALRNWLTVAPRNRTTYRFTGLEDAKDAGATMQLVLQPKASSTPPDNQLRLELEVNGRAYADPRSGRPLPPVRNNTLHTAYLLTEDIRDDGTIDVTVIHTGAELDQSAVSFAPGEGMQVYYKVGSFAGNLAKGMFVMWVRLGFLAALGLAAATFLGFPVACLACFLVLLAAVGSEYLGESLGSYASIPREQVPWWDKIWLTVGKFLEQVRAGEVYDAFKLVVRLVGEAFTFVVPPLARYSPTPEIAYGRAIPGSMIVGVLVRIGLISTGVLAVAAAWIFSRREVARVTV
jgi:ABC-type transport system involved in multi-copper enzyme maturation permease subunit